MESKLVVSCGMTHNIIKICHVVTYLGHFTITDHERTDVPTYTPIEVHTFGSYNTKQMLYIYS